MDNLSPLFDQLREAIDDAFWGSDRVLDALEALEKTLGDFRISIDVILPDRTEFKVAQPRLGTDDTARSDAQFLKLMKVKLDS